MFTRLLTGPFRLAPSRLGLGRAPDGRRLVRRLAGSALLQALTAPHGVERYLELVLPGFSLHELRASRGGPHGHLTRAQLHTIDRHYRQAEVYVCGPPGLIAAARALWARDGHEERVHSESFLPPRLVMRTGEVSGSVRFAASGVEVAASGVTLLEQAEQAGLSPAYGCRLGICHTCTTRKLAGQVRNVFRGRAVLVRGAGDPDLRLGALR